MKALNTLLSAIITTVLLTGSPTTQAQPGFRANLSFQTFYEELSPYGRWMRLPRYGQVWVYNEPGFRPYYTNGHWVNTDLGWSWTSGYPWGWAPFHYGRWEYDPFYGWFWIPGYDYAPAWVIWSEVDDYYGWAPLGFGVDINIAIGHIPSNRWIYAPRRRITYTRIDRYSVPFERTHVYYSKQKPIVNIHVHNNVRYVRGPLAEPRGNAGRPANRQDVYGNQGSGRREPRRAPERSYSNPSRVDALSTPVPNVSQQPNVQREKPTPIQQSRNNRVQQNNNRPANREQNRPARVSPQMQNSTEPPSRSTTNNNPVRNYSPSSERKNMPLMSDSRRNQRIQKAETQRQ